MRRTPFHILLFYYCLWLLACFHVHCDVGEEAPQHSQAKLNGLMQILVDLVKPLDSSPPSSSNSQPYAVSSPFSLPPYDSLPPTNTPTPPFCIFPPAFPSSPPSPPASFSPSFPFLNGPPTPPQSILSPPPPPASVVAPSPPQYAVPSPSTYVPSPPMTVFGPPQYAVPSPFTYVLSPPMPVFSPPQYAVPSPPTNVPSPPMPGFGPPPFSFPSPPLFMPPIVYPAPTVPPPRYPAPVSALWCVAKPSVPEPIIQEALNYACESGADCEQIQPSGWCYEPDTLMAHASYAFNSYWQRTKVAGGTCEFGGVAILVTVDPSYDGCHFIYL